METNATGILKAEIAKRGMKLNEVSDRLKDAGVEISTSNISTRINRGKFTAEFFLQVLSVVGCKKLHIEP